MRKAWFGWMMAATVLSPIAAQAQESEDYGSSPRAQQRVERRQERVEQRQERVEQRQERVEQRQERVERAPRAEPSQAVIEARQQRREERFERRGSGVAPGSSYPSAWQGDPNDPRRQRYERLERRNQERFGGQDTHGHRADNRQHGDHRDLHRDLNREHRDLHRNDPTRREHREWHRDARDDHRAEHRDTHRDQHRDYNAEHRDLHRGDPTRREHREFHRDVNRDHRQYHREWDRGWRTDRRYDWNSWRYRNRDLFRLGSYYSPYRGHRYSRFSIGFFLEPLFFRRNYWVQDPWQYRLPYAPPGTQWIRYYNDVLLVDVYTGEVVDVIYDFFW